MFQHTLISNELNIFKKYTQALTDITKENRLQIFSYIKDLNFLIRELHHHVEEDILFPELVKWTDLSLGGPSCTLYFGLSLESKENEYIKKEITNNLYIPKPTYIKSTQDFIDNNSPLKIPLEEHDFGYYYLKLLEKELSNNCSLKKINVILNYYFNLMKIHIEKEDNCLFKVALNSIPEETKIKLCEKAILFESNILSKNVPMYRKFSFKCK